MPCPPPSGRSSISPGSWNRCGFVLAGEVIGAVLLRLTVYRWLLRLLRWPLRLCCKLLHGVGKLLGALWKLVQKWLPEQPGPGLEDGNFSEESTNSP